LDRTLFSLDISRRMLLEMGFRRNMTWWRGFGSAGVPPAISAFVSGPKMPAGRRRYQTPLSTTKAVTTDPVTRIVVSYHG